MQLYKCKTTKIRFSKQSCEWERDNDTHTHTASMPEIKEMSSSMSRSIDHCNLMLLPKNFVLSHLMSIHFIHIVFLCVNNCYCYAYYIGTLIPRRLLTISLPIACTRHTHTFACVNRLHCCALRFCCCLFALFFLLSISLHTTCTTHIITLFGCHCG